MKYLLLLLTLLAGAAHREPSNMHSRCLLWRCFLWRYMLTQTRKDPARGAAMNFPVPLWLMRAIWWLQKKGDAPRNPTAEQGAAIADYYTKAANMFSALGINAC